MRIAVVCAAGRNREKLLTLCRSLARGIMAQGHQVDVVDATTDGNARLTSYQYLAIGSEGTTLFTGKLPEVAARFLKAAGTVAGKRSYAFVFKGRIGYRRALLRLMQAMESEGMYLKNSGVLATEGEAEAVGQRLQVD